MSEHHGAPSDSTTQSGSSSGAPETVSSFKAEISEACQAAVESYYSAKISKADVLLELIRILGSKDVTEQQRPPAFKVFFTMVEEHDKRESESLRCTTERDVQLAPPVDDNADEDEQAEEPPRADLLAPQGKRTRDDDTGDRSDSVRRRVDESIIPFAHSAFTAELRDELRNTLRLKENYTRNLDFSKQMVISHPQVPEFPQALWKDVLANNYIDLDKVLSDEYSITGDPKIVERFGDSGYSLVAGDLKASKSVRSHGEWIIAWNAYVDAVSFAYPHRVRELRAYGAEVTRFFSAMQLEFAERVIQFDRAARSRTAKSNQILLSDLSKFNDLSLRHLNSAGASVTQPAAKASPPRGRSNEICRRFNDGVCVSNTCRFRHACFSCKARDHGAHVCNKASGSQSKDQRK